MINSVLGSTLASRVGTMRRSSNSENDRDGPEFDLAHWFLGQAYENKGRLAEAIGDYEKAIQLDPDTAILASLARAYALGGRKEKARKILDDLTNESRQRYIPAYSLAVIHLALGDKNEALRLLEKSYEDREPFDTGVFGSIKIDRRIEPLRGNPRFRTHWQRRTKEMNGVVSQTQ